MQGEGRSVEDHRAYWSRLVGAVASARMADTASSRGESNGSPLAQTIQALGAPVAEPPRGVRREQGPALPPWLGPIVLALLVAEWASRRTRGAT
jgi:hypothetical protein